MHHKSNYNDSPLPDATKCELSALGMTFFKDPRSKIKKGTKTNTQNSQVVLKRTTTKNSMFLTDQNLTFSK